MSQRRAKLVITSLPNRKIYLFVNFSIVWFLLNKKNEINKYGSEKRKRGRGGDKINTLSDLRYVYAYLKLLHNNNVPKNDDYY